MTSRGLTAERGSDAYPHKFGGSSWAIRAPGQPSPALLMCLVAADPRLELDPQLGEVPLCSRLDGASLAPQSYVFNPVTRGVAFEGERWDVELDPMDVLPNPLPESPLRLRDLTAGEDQEQTDRYDVQDTFLGGGSFLRVGGTPLWIFDAEDVQCTCGRECDFVAAIGYENYDHPSGLVAPATPFFFGEIALYFFLCPPCARMAVLSQATLRGE